MEDIKKDAPEVEAQRQKSKKILNIDIELLPTLIVSCAIGAFIGCILARLF